MSRNGIGLAAAALILAAIFVAVLAFPRETARSSPSAGVTATATASASATTSPSATTSAAGTGAPPFTGGRFASVLGYSIELPSPWHKSICSRLYQGSPDPRVEHFLAVAPRDETIGDLGYPVTTLRVFAEANPQSLTPRQWAEQGKTIGQTAGERIEDVTYAGRPAVRKTVPGSSLASYFVGDRGRMIVVNPDLRSPVDVAMQQAIQRMADSFTFLTDAERTAARAALPPAPPQRTPEQLADSLAAAFSAKDTTALSGLAAPCIASGGENAGLVSVSAEKYFDDLKAAFAAGLVVIVRARPIEGDRTTGNLTIGSAWQDSRGTKERKLMLQRGVNERWEWLGTIELR